MRSRATRAEELSTPFTYAEELVALNLNVIRNPRGESVNLEAKSASIWFKGI